MLISPEGLPSKVLAAALIAAAALATLAPASRASTAPEAVISSVYAERHGEVFELHFKLSGAPRIRLSRNSDELWIDLGRTRLDIPPRPLFGAETAPLSSLRAIAAPDGNARLVLEVSEKTDYALARIPHEILVRLAPAGKVPDLAKPLLVRRDPAETKRQNPDNPHPASQFAYADARRPLPGQGAGKRSADEGSAPANTRDTAHPAADDRDHTPERVIGEARVVIDAGHGGRDPGTLDASGRFAEKDLALQISRRLAEALKARGVSVKMTRDSDTFLSLPERTRLANDANADLFVSLHLNSSANPTTAGIEVYYLNNTTDRAALRLARMENGGDNSGYSAPSGPNLNYILSSLRQDYKAAESASLARMIEAQTVTELNEAFNLGVNPLGARMGPFYVLVGAHMPAVLVEAGFLSNHVEAERLASPAYQERLADGIAAAVVHYLNADLALGNL